MTETLYRGIDKSTGDWVFGFLREVEGEKLIYLGRNNFCQYYEIEEGSLGMCTGLVDRSYDVIYEGDIISSESSDAIAVVSKDGKYFMANDRRLTVVYSDSRIVGNIYENPEFVRRN